MVAVGRLVVDTVTKLEGTFHLHVARDIGEKEHLTLSLHDNPVLRQRLQEAMSQAMEQALRDYVSERYGEELVWLL